MFWSRAGGAPSSLPIQFLRSQLSTEDPRRALARKKAWSALSHLNSQSSRPCHCDASVRQSKTILAQSPYSNVSCPYRNLDIMPYIKTLNKNPAAVEGAIVIPVGTHHLCVLHSPCRPNVLICEFLPRAGLQTFLLPWSALNPKNT